MKRDWVPKAIKVIIKASVAILTIPATWAVAEALTVGLPLWGDPIIRTAAVLLVDGLFMYNWWMLEDPKSTPEQKAVFATFTAVAFGSILVIGFIHEGLVAPVFRATMAAAVLSSGWESYASYFAMLNVKQERDVRHSPKVRRAIRKDQQAVAILASNLDASVQMHALRTNADMELKRITAQAEVGEVTVETQKAVDIKQATRAVTRTNGNGGGKEAKRIILREFGVDPKTNWARIEPMVSAHIKRARFFELKKLLVEEGLLIPDGDGYRPVDDWESKL